METRDEYLRWCKQRALELVEADPLGAWTSLVSDLTNNPLTAGHDGINLGTMQVMTGMLSTPKAMRDFIEGFN